MDRTIIRAFVGKGTEAGLELQDVFIQRLG
jgi:hypothetical protein